MGRWDDGVSLDAHREFTQINNYLLDYVFPIIPQDDADVMLYAWRRTQGYGVTERAISYEEFTAGRCTAEGKPLDFGTGLAKSRVSDALGRLSAAGLMLIKRKGKAGRPSSTALAKPQGTVWEVCLDKAAHDFSPLFAAMSYGQLGRYVKAARFGILPPPRTPQARRLLEQAIKARHAQAPTQPKIEVPAEWGQLVPARNEKELSQPGTIPGENCSNMERNGSTVEQLGGEIPRPDAGKNPPKETLEIHLSRKKPLIPPPAAGAAPGSGKASKDGLPAQEWVERFTQHCYGGHALAEWGQYVKAVAWLREHFPLAVVLAFHDSKKRERGNLARTITPRQLANDIVSWPGLGDAQRQWEVQHGGGAGVAVDASGAQADGGTGRPAPVSPGGPGAVRSDGGDPERTARLLAKLNRHAGGMSGLSGGGLAATGV